LLIVLYRKEQISTTYVKILSPLQANRSLRHAEVVESSLCPEIRSLPATPTFGLDQGQVLALGVVRIQNQEPHVTRIRIVGDSKNSVSQNSTSCSHTILDTMKHNLNFHMTVLAEKNILLKKLYIFNLIHFFLSRSNFYEHIGLILGIVMTPFRILV